MTAATLRKVHIDQIGRPIGDEPPETQLWSEPIFEADIDGAIAFARSLPADEQPLVEIETDHGTFAPYAFDRLEAGTLLDDDYLEVEEGVVMRVTSAAHKLMAGAVDYPISPLRLINDNIDKLDKVLAEKRIDGLVELIDGRPTIVIDAADLQ